MVRELLEVTLSGDLDPVVRKRLAEIAQLIQSYCRLAELEVASGEAPRFPGKGYVALPEDTAERVKGWAEDKERKMREGKEVVEELSQAMRAKGHDPTPIREAMGG